MQKLVISNNRTCVLKLEITSIFMDKHEILQIKTLHFTYSSVILSV